MERKQGHPVAGFGALSDGSARGFHIPTALVLSPSTHYHFVFHRGTFQKTAGDSKNKSYIWTYLGIFFDPVCIHIEEQGLVLPIYPRQ